MNTICVLAEVAMIHALGFPIFGLQTFPDWAETLQDAALSGAGNITTLAGNVVTGQHR